MTPVTTRVPGIAARHAIVTPTCRANRGDEGAVDEALRRLREEALAVIACREDEAYDLHLVLTVEAKAR